MSVEAVKKSSPNTLSIFFHLRYSRSTSKQTQKQSEKNAAKRGGRWSLRREAELVGRFWG